MLTSASTLAPRARLHPHVAPGAAAFPAVLLRHRQQIRSFRFGAWAGNESGEQHREQQREMRRRCRADRHTNADLSRKRLWGRQQTDSGDAPPPFSQRWVGTRSGDRQRWDTPFDDIRRYMAKRHGELLREAGFGTQSKPFAPAATGSPARTSSGVVEETDFFIDPITNRKVFKASAKSTTTTNAAPDSDLPPTPAELRAYKNVAVNDVLVDVGSKSAARQVPPDFSSVSDNSDACYMSWKYKGVFSGRGGSNGVLPNAAEYKDLHKYKPVHYNEPDGTLPEMTAVQDPEELRQYKPVAWNEPDGQPTELPVEIGRKGYDPEEVSKYRPVRWNEPDGKPDIPVELGHEGYDPEEVAKYKPFYWNEPDGKPTRPPVEIGHEGYDPAEVAKYKPFKHNESDGKPQAAVDSTSESLKEYDLKAKASQTPEEVYAKILQRVRKLSMEVDEPVSENVTASSDANPALGKQPSQSREALESSLDRMNAESDAVDRLAQTSVKASQGRSRRRLSAEERKQALTDPYSAEPQGLETAFAEECTDTNMRPAYSKTYKAVSRQDNASADHTAAAPGSASGAKPVLYKILAYDAATQSVRIAETTSTVPDMAAPLAPGEVMLRLSHPTKFIPHLKWLEKQGFEMVSGSGDVLVFRQMLRDEDATGRGTAAASPVNGAGTASSLSSSSSSSSSSSPSSPLQGTARMGQSVRREEAVFSGSKAGAAEPVSESSGKKGPSLGKRVVVGATWAAGVSYALGVVSEYAKGL